MDSSGYKTFHRRCSDANFPQCIEGTCNYECCDAKPVEMPDRSTFQANTICSQNELDAMVNRWIEAMPGIQFRTYEMEGYTPQILISGCKTAEGCGLGNLRPLTCKFTPFEVMEPIGILEVERDRCRHALRIAQDTDARRVVLDMLSELDLPENMLEAWMPSLDWGLRIIRQQSR